MKLVFDKKGLINDHMLEKVIAIPTTANEKYFFSICKDANGNYKPEVYNALYKLDEQIIDNPMSDIYDNHGNLIYNSEPIFDMLLDMTRNGDDYVGIPKPSNFCILSLYYTLSKKFRKARRVKLLYEKKTEMFLNQTVVTIKEKENANEISI